MSFKSFDDFTTIDVEPKYTDVATDLCKKLRGIERSRKTNPYHLELSLNVITLEKDKQGNDTFNVQYAWSKHPSITLRILLSPLYALSAIAGGGSFLEWLENLTYFRKVTQKGINRRYFEIESSMRLLDAKCDSCIREFNKHLSDMISE